MRNLSFAVLALLCGSSSAFAQNLNLVSETCDHASKLESTGFVLSFNQQVYVLASADFVYNDGSPKFCHQVIDANGGAHPLQIARYDWGSGLALLKGDDSLAAFATPLTSVASKLLAKVSWETGSAQLVSVHSKRHFIPLIDEALELKASDTNSHGVGSAMVDATGGLVGFISSQLIEEVPGHSARVTRWLDRQDKTSQQLIALSSITVAKWMETVLQPQWHSPFEIDSQSQLKKKYRLTIGGVTFTEICPPPGEPSDGPTMPIGGGDPVGIGGGDPVGIGGDTNSSPACRFDTSKATKPAALISLDPFLSHRKKWIADLEAELDKNVTHSIAWSYTGVLFGADYQAWGIVSLGNFAQTMLRTEYGFVYGSHDHNKPDGKKRR